MVVAVVRTAFIWVTIVSCRCMLCGEGGCVGGGDDGGVGGDGGGGGFCVVVVAVVMTPFVRVAVVIVVEALWLF